ncbi:2-C-methyl-D-erythritol 4-phosphate cytidylyltransferase [Bacillus sp. S/N-304-OC-R1]|uniref:2-C-methyl-D-erythritol 4-phosphate cytidylyltransferase n=1 Tax=Bacillus sp. S/N-304-OC-R1 TaxID=2758034 RepID=UPI001C8D0BA0|nr:2-C-methyl-D-erythritol 4-phosphate cytidylyltransferase [Bacillus sp. S/N-304-OC-R1]MBY0121892.1 2-C-methyl-D-erythritol 4-phosphate cytidylyltransferase [Bacillus sp. S/N-304-OC-R1]
MAYQVIIPAAGQGKRMGAGRNKVLLELNQLPIFIHTLKVFEMDQDCNGIYLAINPRDESEMKALLHEHHITKVVALAPGGKERQHSIYNALKFVKQKGIILVHDAARPFINKKLLDPLVKAAEENGASILAVPVKDTVKKAAGKIVTETVERTSLWAVQTPQAFRFSILMQAYQKAEQDDFLGTDDASLVERIGHNVVIVEGSYDNIKLTTPEDLYFAEAIIRKQNGNHSP